MGIEQKVAVITGASQGIGAALVKAYRDRNYRVVATARSIKPSNDDEVIAVPGDIADRKTAERAISEGMARFGRIDTLVNNAGIFIAKPFTQYTEADYAAMIAVNLAGFFHITQVAVAEMEKQGSGHVVQITTSMVDHAMSGVPAVLAALTKGGLNAATKSLAIEYARSGIRVNAVADLGAAPPSTPSEVLPAVLPWARVRLGARRLAALGHRVVHGGLRHSRPARVTPELLAELEALVPLAPLHEPHNLAPIKMALTLNPDLPQVACSSERPSSTSSTSKVSTCGAVRALCSA